MMQDISSKWQTILLLVQTRSLTLLSSMPLLCKKKERKKEILPVLLQQDVQYNYQLCPFYGIQKFIKRKPCSMFCVTFHNIMDFYDQELLAQSTILVVVVFIISMQSSYRSKPLDIGYVIY
jgi:hypothetical protein